MKLNFNPVTQDQEEELEVKLLQPPYFCSYKMFAEKSMRIIFIQL